MIRSQLSKTQDVSVAKWPHADTDSQAGATNDNLVGTVLHSGGTERFRLVERIAAGGMGVVYRARDMVLDRDVGLKTLLRLAPEGSTHANRFRDEARITGQLQHPNIPPVHDLGSLPDGRPYLAMKLINGRTLEALLAERPDPATDRGRFLAVFEQIAQAVGYAHARGVIHRDLKPLNVMVGAFGEVQVMDWGLAKVLATELTQTPAPASADTAEFRTLLARGSAATSAGSLLGTLAYMPPEQANGVPEWVDTRSDVFGLGAVLCVILTGSPPYRPIGGQGLRHLAVRAKLDDCFARLDACGADPGFVALCKRCLAPDRDARPHDAGVVAQELARIQAELDERARRAELDRVRAEGAVKAAELRALEQRKRRKMQLALLAAGFLLVTGGGAGAWWQDHHAAERKRADEAQAAERKLERERAEGELKAEQLAFERERQVRAEQAGARVTELVKLGTELRRQYRYPEADGALDQARELAATANSPALTKAVERARAELAFVRELDAVRMRRSTLQWTAEGGARFDKDRAPGEYRAAFAAHGLNVTADPDGVGAAVAASEARAELVAALDDWALLEPAPVTRDRVLTALRAADPDSAAAPFRDPAVWADPVTMGCLAAAADGARMSPGAAVAVGELLRRTAPAAAARLLRQALMSHPRDFALAFALGLVLKTGDPEQIGAYRAARAIRPDNMAVLNNLGVALYASGEPGAAEPAFREVLRLNPEHVNGLNNLGIVLSELRDWAGGAAAFREAIRRDPKDAKLHHNLAGTLKAAGAFDGALASYRAALKCDPRFAPAHQHLGVALAQAGALGEAIAALREAVRFAPEDPTGYHNLGLVLARAGERPAAVAAIRTAIRLNPADPVVHLNLGLTLLDARDAPGAVIALREAVRLDPKSPKAHLNLGLALRNSGALAEAIGAYREAARLDPTDAATFVNMGIALAMKGEPDEGIIAFQKAIELAPRLATAHFNLAVTLKNQGKLPEAADAYREAARCDPKFLQAHAHLAAVELARKRYPEAVTSARAAISLQPKFAEAHAVLGLALANSGDTEGGRAALTEATRLDARYQQLLNKLPPPSKD